MAEIFFMQEGLTDGQTVDEKSLSWCIDRLHIKIEDWWADLNTKFAAGSEPKLLPYYNPRWVLIRVDEIEATGGWKSGFYFSPRIKIDQVKTALS